MTHWIYLPRADLLLIRQKLLAQRPGQDNDDTDAPQT